MNQNILENIHVSHSIYSSKIIKKNYFDVISEHLHRLGKFNSNIFNTNRIKLFLVTSEITKVLKIYLYILLS